MICNNADKCKSTECSHRMPHEYDPDMCREGMCRWAANTRCIPEDPKEEITNLLTDHVDASLLTVLVDQIVRVFEEAQRCRIWPGEG